MGRRNQNRPPKRKPETSVAAPDFPRFETADFEDPESHALWALAGLPHLNGAPLGMPIFMLKAISKRLWDAGFRHHPELRTIKYRPPHAGHGVSMFLAAGEWVPIDAPDEGEPEVTAEMKRQMASALGITAADLEPSPEVAEKVPYTRADGSTVMVTPAQARAWRNARTAEKEARGR